MHQIESVVDVLERHLVRNEIIDVDFAVHVPIDDFGHVGAAPRAAERGALPDATGDQLERPRGDFFARAGDANDDRNPPAAVGALERLAHEIDVADALETVVGAAIGEGHKVRNQIALDFLGIDEVGHAEFFRQRLAAIVQVDADDLVGAHQTRALNDIETNAAQAEHDYVGTCLDFRGVDDGPDPRGHAATDVADFVEGRILANFRDGDFGQYGEIRERRTAHVVMHQILADGKTARAVRHEALALSGANGGAQIGLVRS